MNAPDDAKRPSPRPRRVPKTRAAQAKADAAAERFSAPRPFAVDAAQAGPGRSTSAWRTGSPNVAGNRSTSSAKSGARSGDGAKRPSSTRRLGAGKTWAVWLGALAGVCLDARSPNPSRTLPKMRR